MNKSNIAAFVFALYILLSFYVFGCGMVNALVAYPTWRAVGEKEFVLFHQIDSARIIPVFVIFFFLSFIPQLMLFWFRPAVIPKWLVGLALICNLIVLVSTVAVQVPIQIQLDKSYSLKLINQLISTDTIFRRIPMVLQAIINFTMLYKALRTVESIRVSAHTSD